MAVHTLTLTDGQELALLVLLEHWQREQPDTVWTPEMVLERMTLSTLDTTLRALDHTLQPVVTLSERVPADILEDVLETLSGIDNARVRQLLARRPPRPPEGGGRE